MCLAACGYPGHFFPCLRVSLESALGPGCVCGAGGWLKLAVMSVSMEEKKTHGLPDLEEY